MKDYKEQKKYYKDHHNKILAKKCNMTLEEYEEKLKLRQEKKIINEYTKLHKEEIAEMKKQRTKEREKIYNAIYFQINKNKIYKKRKEA